MRRCGRLWFLAFLPSPLSGSPTFPFISAYVPYPSSTCRIDFFRIDTCPISPYPEWLGVVVKVGEYGSVRCRVLNGIKDSFPWSFTLSSVSFSIDRDIFRFFPSCSYTIFALPFSETSDMLRTKSSSAVPQDHFVLVLPSLGYNLPQLGPWALMNKRVRALNHWAPQ